MFTQQRVQQLESKHPEFLARGDSRHRALHGAHRGDDLSASVSSRRPRARRWRSAAEHVGAGVGGASRCHGLQRTCSTPNIFYPERRTLAYSETLLVPALFAAPLFWLGVGRLLRLQPGVPVGVRRVGRRDVSLLVRTLTGSAAAGRVAGLVFAFLPHRIDHFPHLQLQQTQVSAVRDVGVPSAAAHGRVRGRRAVRRVQRRAGAVVVYYGLLLLPHMAVVCGATLIAERRLPKDRILALAVAAGDRALPR